MDQDEGFERDAGRSAGSDGEVALGALESAENYVAASSGAGGTGDGGGTAFALAFKALLEWGEQNGLIFPESRFPFFTRPPDGYGDEHQAWFDAPSGRWFKATYPNRFGLAWWHDGSATAGEYLRRLVLQNQHFGDDIRLEALVEAGGKLRVLTSQPHIAGEAAHYEKIQKWFLDLGFRKIEDDGRIAWYRERENLIVADAHEGNIIETEKKELVPIDLNICQPDAEAKEWVLKKSTARDTRSK